MPKTYLTPSAKTRLAQDAAEHRVIYGTERFLTDDARQAAIERLFDEYMREILLTDGEGCHANQFVARPVHQFADGLCFGLTATDFMLDNKAPGVPLYKPGQN